MTLFGEGFIRIWLPVNKFSRMAGDSGVEWLAVEGSRFDAY